MRTLALLLLATAGAGATCAVAQTAPLVPAEGRADTPRPPSRGAEEQRVWALGREIEARIEAGTANAEADATAAADRGEFGLIVTEAYRNRPRAPGLICFTPGYVPPRLRASRREDDAPGPEDMPWFNYATAYNLRLATRSDYPDADICRPSANDRDLPREEAGATIPARAVAGPPRSLHETGRRGSAADVRRLLGATAVDAFDGLDMTALAWAVARDNWPAAEALLAAGANPWAGAEWQGGLPVYLAAMLGRGDWFARLAARPGRPFERWSNRQIRAAIIGGEPTVLALMLREPHEPVQIDAIPYPLPSAAIVEILLRDTRALAGPLLRRAASLESRADLVRLALAYGADPSRLPALSGTETPLGSSAGGIAGESVEIVDLLLRAGADPNAFSLRYRPLWHAVRTLVLERPDEALNARARASFRRLRAAGADINLPDLQGRPPIWALLFPRNDAPRTLDTRGVTPALLEMLARAGLNLNARWQGERVLSEVVRQAGPRSALAVTLRRLGARL